MKIRDWEDYTEDPYANFEQCSKIGKGGKTHQDDEVELVEEITPRPKKVRKRTQPAETTSATTEVDLPIEHQVVQPTNVGKGNTKMPRSARTQPAPAQSAAPPTEQTNEEDSLAFIAEVVFAMVEQKIVPRIDGLTGEFETIRPAVTELPNLVGRFKYLTDRNNELRNRIDHLMKTNESLIEENRQYREVIAALLKKLGFELAPAAQHHEETSPPAEETTSPTQSEDVSPQATMTPEEERRERVRHLAAELLQK